MRAKYANLHSGLLARKGEATPATPTPAPNVSYIDSAPAQPVPAEPSKLEGCRPFDLKPGETKPLTGRHKASLRLTGEQKRRLKTLDHYLDSLCAGEFKDCGCLKRRG